MNWGIAKGLEKFWKLCKESFRFVLISTEKLPLITPYSIKQRKSFRFFITAIIGVTSSLVFSKMHLPLPWLLGPLASVLVISRFIKINLYWPTGLRNLALIIIGYNSGLSINNEAIGQIIQQLPWMLAMTVALIGFSVVTASFVSKHSGIDYPSVLMGNIPGGMAQIMTLAEEIKGINLTVVTFLQVLRIILVVFFVPFILFSPLYSLEKSGFSPSVKLPTYVSLHLSLPNILLFAILSLFFAFLAKKIKFPTPYLLGPILGIAALSVSGIHGPSTSRVLLDIAQLSMGCYLGVMMKPEQLQNKVKLVSLALLNGLVTIFFSLGLSYILIKMHGFEAATSFLCLAPGGADQMGVIAAVISADMSLVTGYQLFRILAINFAIPPFLKRICLHYARINQAD